MILQLLLFEWPRAHHARSFLNISIDLETTRQPRCVAPGFRLLCLISSQPWKVNTCQLILEPSAAYLQLKCLSVRQRYRSLLNQEAIYRLCLARLCQAGTPVRVCKVAGNVTRLHDKTILVLRLYVLESNTYPNGLCWFSIKNHQLRN